MNTASLARMGMNPMAMMMMGAAMMGQACNFLTSYLNVSFGTVLWKYFGFTVLGLWADIAGSARFQV